MENFISTESSTSTICSMSLTFGALLCLPPNTELGSLPAWDSCTGVCPLLPYWLHLHVARGNPVSPSSCFMWLLLPVSVLPGLCRCSQGQGKGSSPFFQVSLMYQCGHWQMENSCVILKSLGWGPISWVWLWSCETLQGSSERPRDSHCHQMRHPSEAKEAKKVQISTGRMNPHRL